jgi:3',5'-cyclic AMP phosphodiesterase CpdA
MTQIAHLSDLHLLEPGHAERSGLARRRLAYLTLGRRNDYAPRKQRAIDLLTAARKSGADHVLLTGDLTEDGLDEQYEELAEVLAESRLSPSKVTLLPGNHDVYADASAFARALRGPLAAFAPTSKVGVPIDLGDATVLPMSTAIPQPYTKSGGAIEPEALAGAARLAEDTRRRGRALVLAMHHPPRRHPFPIMQWIDGLRDHAHMGEILARHDHVHVVHGHTHVATDHAVRPGATPRIFSTESVIDGRAPLRMYEARHGRLAPAAREARGVGALVMA